LLDWWFPRPVTYPVELGDMTAETIGWIISGLSAGVGCALVYLSLRSKVATDPDYEDAPKPPIDPTDRYGASEGP
jgi:hypothetical protein